MVQDNFDKSEVNLCPSSSLTEILIHTITFFRCLLIVVMVIIIREISQCPTSIPPKLTAHMKQLKTMSMTTRCNMRLRRENNNRCTINLYNIALSFMKIHFLIVTNIYIYACMHTHMHTQTHTHTYTHAHMHARMYTHTLSLSLSLSLSRWRALNLCVCVVQSCGCLSEDKPATKLHDDPLALLLDCSSVGC